MLNNADDGFFDDDAMGWGQVLSRLEPQQCKYREEPEHDGHGHMAPSSDWPNPKQKPGATLSPLREARFLRYRCDDCRYEVEFTILSTGRVDGSPIVLNEPSYG